ncbi:hypothetical protein A9G43_03850 [Gilliamella sp. Occ3-1]|uniref:hypothetical protein n=1 Tax=Gilliamella sp. Occ3-1 TaxID=3120253 RepID=UPI00080DB3F1|nr:hypothetical protein [Gilliamella apicola]OCG71895.1 hypothetical protein A9G43_03850 [Gilliamella apicola]
MEELIPQNEHQEHMVQVLLAKMQGVPVEYKRGADWCRAVPDSVSLNTEYRIAPQSTPLPISREMWTLIDRTWNYAAIDANGRVFFFERKPYIVATDELWSSNTGKYIGCALAINIEGINWKWSLTERPEDV